MKYIDAEKLKAEIDNLESFSCISEEQDGFYSAISRINGIIDSLQQEQPAQKKNCAGCPHCIDRKDQYGWHFKGCFGGPYNGKFIAEIDECPLKQEQPEIFDTVAFQKGVQEGKRLMMEEAIVYVAQPDAQAGNIQVPFIRIGSTALFRYGIKVGDKVRIVIVKEEEHERD